MGLKPGGRLIRALAYCIAAIVAAMGAGAASSAQPRGAVAIMPFKLLDTSSEPNDQRADHERRLKAMGADIGRELPGDPTFASATAVDPAAIAAACRPETPDCLLGVARSGGAKFALFGVLHKSSTLIMQLFLSVVSVDGRTVLVSRELSFRGDSDESWSRAKDCLVAQIREELGARPKATIASAPPR